MKKIILLFAAFLFTVSVANAAVYQTTSSFGATTIAASDTDSDISTEGVDTDGGSDDTVSP